MNERPEISLPEAPSRAPGRAPAGRALTSALALVTLSALTGCMTTHLARPVGAGNTRVHASLGGPLIRLGGATLPLPITTLGVAHGLGDDVDVHADLHPTAAVFNPGAGSTPLLGVDAGVAWHPIPRHRSALTLGATLYGFGNKLDATVFADAWVAGGIRPVSWLFLSIGLHNQLRIGSSDREVSQRSFWAPTAFALVSFGPFRRVSIDVEARWYSFTENASRVAPDWVATGPVGALGVLLGLSYQFPQGGGPR